MTTLWDSLAERIAAALQAADLDSRVPIEGEPGTSAANAAVCRDVVEQLKRILHKAEADLVRRQRSWFRKPSKIEVENVQRIIEGTRGVIHAVERRAAAIEEAIEWRYPDNASPAATRRSPVPAGFEVTGETIPDQMRRDSKPTRVRRPLQSGQVVYFGFSATTPWADIYAKKRRAGERDGLYTGEYDRFGFHMERERWSYGEGPPGAREIREMLAEIPEDWYGKEPPPEQMITTFNVGDLLS